MTFMEMEFHVFFLQYLVLLKHGIQSVKKACDKNHVTTSTYLLSNSLFTKFPPCDTAESERLINVMLALFMP